MLFCGRKPFRLFECPQSFPRCMPRRSRQPAPLAAAALSLALGAAGLLTPLLAAPALAQSQRPAPRPVSRPTVSVPAFKNTVTQQTWW